MGRITIVHKTEYTYRRPIGLLRHRLMLRPDDSHDLRLHRSDLRVEPKPSRIEWKHDAFDNSICFLDWPEDLRTDHLQIVSTVDLTHHPDGPPRPVYILDQAACSNITRRARFTPAKDGSGNPVQDTYSNRVRWVIPE